MMSKLESKKVIRICALTLYPYDTIPGQRFRIEQWEPILNKDRITIDYYSFADSKLIATMPLTGNFFGKVFGLISASIGRLTHLLKLPQYDVIYLYRAAAMVGPSILERIIKLFGKPIVFDFDDAIFLTDTAAANRRFGWAKFSGKTSGICRLSDHVIVGNSYLAEYAKQFNQNVTIVPSGVDTVKFIPQKRKRDGNKIIVGWTGSSTSQTHLEMFSPMLKAVFANQSEIELHVHSDREPVLPQIPFVWHRWTTENEVEVLSTFDIGIMPIPDDKWSRGKCAMKALLYMSLGIPTICSNVGANRDVISNGLNGLLCTTTEDWVNAVKSLVNDCKLRRRLGDAGRQTIEERFSAEQCASLFTKVVIDTLIRSASKTSSRA